MTDQHEPEERTPYPPGDRGMPAAGGKPGPAPAAQPPDAEGPTVPMRRPIAPPADQPPAEITPRLAHQETDRSITRPPGEERTVVTPPRTGSAADEEPTVESLRSAASRPPDDGGETVRLRPPTVVPGPVGESGAPPKPAASGAPAPAEAAASPLAQDTSVPVEPPPAQDTSVPVEPPPAQDTSVPVEPAAAQDTSVPVEPPAAPGASASGAGGVGAPESGGPEAVSPDPVISSEDAATRSAGEADVVPDNGVDRGKAALRRRLSSAGTLIWVLLALFGFTLVVQLRSNNADEGLATARQEDLVRILSDLEARDQRLQAEITALEQSQRQLTSGVQGRQAAVAEAQKRANELGLLAGTLPGRGPGLRVTIDPKGQVKASAVLNAVQELRGAGGEVMEIVGAGGRAVRIVASTYFIDANGGGIVVDGTRLNGPYTLWVIGVPQTMQTALQIPGGVVASVSSAGGSVTMEARSMVEVTAVRKPTGLQYARPVS
jgi:uncharacterized protein YlxW (UPF0749 family)